METKPRILYLQKILLERTDEENPLSTTQLINILMMNTEYLHTERQSQKTLLHFRNLEWTLLLSILLRANTL